MQYVEVQYEWRKTPIWFTKDEWDMMEAERGKPDILEYKAWFGEETGLKYYTEALKRYTEKNGY